MMADQIQSFDDRLHAALEHLEPLPYRFAMYQHFREYREAVSLEAILAGEPRDVQDFIDRSLVNLARQVPTTKCGPIEGSENGNIR